MKFYLRNLNRPEHDYSGMTVLELLLAIAMFVVFTGVVVMVMQFTLRFFSAAESGKPNKLGAFDGVLIDHGKLHIAMDAFVEVLSQPGVSMKGYCLFPIGSAKCGMSRRPCVPVGLRDADG